MSENVEELVRLASSHVVHVKHADGEDVKPLVIVADEPVDVNIPVKSMEDVRQAYDADARSLFDAMTKHLPGGTQDRLFAYMARHKACDLSIPYHELRRRDVKDVEDAMQWLQAIIECSDTVPRVTVPMALIMQRALHAYIRRP